MYMQSYVYIHIFLGGVPYALEMASMKEFRDFSDTVLNNILIYYDRYSFPVILILYKCIDNRCL
jgi:hypothetical protein